MLFPLIILLEGINEKKIWLTECIPLFNLLITCRRQGYLAPFQMLLLYAKIIMLKYMYTPGDKDNFLCNFFCSNSWAVTCRFRLDTRKKLLWFSPETTAVEFFLTKHRVAITITHHFFRRFRFNFLFICIFRLCLRNFTNFSSKIILNSWKLWSTEAHVSLAPLWRYINMKETKKRHVCTR